jgi:hypothetical protein
MHGLGSELVDREEAQDIFSRAYLGRPVSVEKLDQAANHYEQALRQSLDSEPSLDTLRLYSIHISALVRAFPERSQAWVELDAQRQRLIQQQDKGSETDA